MNKKIVLFTAEFPFGQQETFLENELKYLSQSFGSIIIVPLFKHHKIRELAYSNVSVYTPVNNTRSLTIYKLVLFLSVTFWKTLGMGLFEYNFHPKSYLKALKQAFIISRFKKYLKKRPEIFDNDLWYFYWGTNAINVIPFLKKTPKIVARYHRYDLYGEDVDGGEIQLFQKLSLNKVNKAIFISHHGREYLRSKLNEFDHKFEVSRLGVPYRGISKFSDDKVLRIVTCSNFYKVKRVDLLARALLAIDDISIEWTHIGGGIPELRHQTLEIVKNFKPNIKFKEIGRISNEQAMDFFKNNRIDLFINVSISEGLPVSIMEALSFGVPVIATKVGGTSELVSKKCGFLLDPYFELSELRQLIRNFYVRYYGDQDMRDEAHNSWKDMVDSDQNYIDFIVMLYKIINDDSKKIKLQLVGASDVNSQRLQ